jgi:hypothetical protein
VNRPAIGPFLATGVVLVGAAAIVANPVVLPPADIRVSAAEYAASSNGLDLLDPRFLESIGAGGKGWQNPVEVLESLLSGLVRDDSDVHLSPLASQFAGLIDVGDPDLLMSTLAAVAIGDLQTDGVSTGVLGPPLSPPGTFGGLLPVGGAKEIVRVLAEIGEGFGEAGVTFIQRLGMTPAVVAELAQQVQAETMAADEALRRMVMAPVNALTGNAELTGNPAIDAAFTDGVLRPVIDALRNTLPGPIVQENGLFGSTDDGVTGAAADIRNTVGPSSQQTATPESVQVAGGDEPTADEAVTETPLAPAAPEAEPREDGNEDDTENVPDTPGNRPPTVGPGGLDDQVTKPINDFGIPILTDGGGPKPGKGAGSSAGSPGSAAGGKGSAAGNNDSG